MDDRPGSFPKVAVAPETDERIEQAVVDGGGELVSPVRASALVWTSPSGASELGSLLEVNPEIEWVQLPWAGVEEFASAGLFDERRVWTSAKGLYSWPVAEHALALALALIHEIPRYSRTSEWSPQFVRTLGTARVLVFGAGGIGREIATLHSTLKCDLAVVTPSGACPVWAIESYPFSERLQAVQGRDVVYLALPLTDDTQGFVDAEFIAALEPTSYLVNVARGGHVNLDALDQGLASGQLAGAGLDVTDPEPLPPTHPLWRNDRCLITPHTASPHDLSLELLHGRVRENVGRFREGRPLEGLVDPRKGY